MDKEQEFNLKLRKSELAKSKTWQNIRTHQLEMIIGFAKNNYEGNDIRAMLKLIAKTDEWEQDFEKAQANRRG